MLAALVDVEGAIDPLPHRSGVQRRLNEHGILHDINVRILRSDLRVQGLA
jgi:hypothetical protein